MIIAVAGGCTPTVTVVETAHRGGKPLIKFGQLSVDPIEYPTDALVDDLRNHIDNFLCGQVANLLMVHLDPLEQLLTQLLDRRLRPLALFDNQIAYDAAQLLRGMLDLLRAIR
jgi:hypothetical protein